MRIPLSTGLLASVVTLCSLAAVPAGAGAATEPRPTSTTASGTSPAEATRAARRALAAAKAAIAGDARPGGRAPQDSTVAARDLAVARQALRGTDRTEADRLLARPTTPPDDPDDPRDISYAEDAVVRSECATTFCLHWVEEGEHAATPAFAATAFETIRDVADTYARAGFRVPLPDEGQEGDDRTDFYLGDLDQHGALGFCRSDASGPVVGSAWYAYCGFDNDYRYSPWLDPASLLRVTVAHEYFHAIQFAYDAEDDGWLMESTATAMEDELFDDVNDNAFFLHFGQMGDPEAFGYPLAGPATPLDTFDLTAYGNWGFWRYLTEQHPDETAGLPDLVREVWEALDTTRGPSSADSLDALEDVLAARGTSTPEQYVAFAAANQHPAAVYDEAVEQAYPTAPNTLDPVDLARSAPTATRTVVLEHLTSATGAARPFAGSRRLTVAVDLGGAGVGGAAVTTYAVGGAVTTTSVPVNPQGRGSLTVPFTVDRIASVEVTLGNGGRADGLAARVRFQATG